MSGSVTARQIVFDPDTVRGVVRPNAFVPFGMGERGEHCGAARLTEYNVDFQLGVRDAPAVVRVRYSPLHCGTIDCPDCYSSVLREDVHRAAVIIEAYARVTGQRPATVVTSVRASDAAEWTHADYGRRLNQRGYRELRKMGAVGGWMATHPYRLSADAKRELRALGYREGMTHRKGFWDGVRHDVLKWGGWRAYVVPGPHRHGIVFPSFLREHENKDFYAAKGRVLETVKDVVAYARYILSHAGKEPGTHDKVCGMWGIFSGRTPWRPEDHMPADELEALRSEIAELLGMRWAHGELQRVEDAAENDGIAWVPVRGLADALKSIRMCSIYNGVSDSQHAFLRRVAVHAGGAAALGAVPTGRESLLLASDLEPLRPDDVIAVWGTRRLPYMPPEYNYEDEDRG